MVKKKPSCPEIVIAICLRLQNLPHLLKSVLSIVAEQDATDLHKSSHSSNASIEIN